MERFFYFLEGKKQNGLLVMDGNQARRAGLEPKDVANTRSFAQFQKLLGK